MQVRVESPNASSQFGNAVELGVALRKTLTNKGKLASRKRHGRSQLLLVSAVGSGHRTACSLLPARWVDLQVIPLDTHS